MSQQCTCNKPQHALLPSAYQIIDVKKHTDLEWNFRVATDFAAQLGQFVEVSLPLVGEAPISVSDCGDGWMDLLIRNVGKVTSACSVLMSGTRSGCAAATATAIRWTPSAINRCW